MRYVLEGVWRGYWPSQDQVVHREVISKQRYARLKDVHSLPFSDGTALLLHIQPAKPREKN
jgi:hypothetical protein